MKGATMNRLLRTAVPNYRTFGLIINGRLQSNEIGHRFASWSSSNKKSDDNVQPVIDPDKPIPFFGSAAQQSSGLHQEYYKPKHEYHPIIAMISVASFLIYFCILREENETDEIFKKDFYDHFGKNGEATALKDAYIYNIKNNLPVTEIVRRLRDIGAPIPPGYLPQRKRN